MYMHQSPPRRLDSIIIVVRQFVRVLVAQWRYSPSPWPGQHYFVVGLLCRRKIQSRFIRRIPLEHLLLLGAPVHFCIPVLGVGRT
jgi:hypothetical protein